MANAALEWCMISATVLISLVSLQRKSNYVSKGANDSDCLTTLN